LLEVDDVVVIILIISRYVMQLLRLINEIKHTHTNRKIQHEIKKVDLNAGQFNPSMNFQDTINIDNQVRARITATAQKNQLVEEVYS